MSTATSTVSGEEVQLLIAKMDRAAKYLPFSHPQELPLDEKAELQPNNLQGTAKHIIQCESIVNHMKEVNLIQKDKIFCEFGCGTAKLSDQLSLMMNGNASHVLIDCQKFGSKRLRDFAMIARAKKGKFVRRVTMDIGDIHDFSSICDFHHVVAMSKHLCGVATDLMIECCSRHRAPLVVATCCHYLCKWEKFSNKSFFETLGFTERDFQVLVITSQWASMLKKNDFNPFRCNDSRWIQFPVFQNIPSEIKLESLVASDEFEREFSRLDKASLGMRCKLFLDTARAHQLISLGYNVKFVRYTTMSIENHLLIASLPAE
jgi:tRNA:m4X modification enzyme